MGFLREHGRAVRSAAVGVLVAGAVVTGVAAPAQAAGRITLTDQGGRWAVSGGGFAAGRTDAQVWVMKTSSWTTHEYQSGLSTSRAVFTPYVFVPGGYLSARGRQYWFPGSGIIAPHWANSNPLQCGVSYQAVAYTPVDGYSYSNVLRTPCPVIH